MSDEHPTQAKQAGDKYIVRFPVGMREQIAQAAKRNGRSMNLEIVSRVGRSLEMDAQPPTTFESELESTRREVLLRRGMAQSSELLVNLMTEIMAEALLGLPARAANHESVRRAQSFVDAFRERDPALLLEAVQDLFAYEPGIAALLRAWFEERRIGHRER